ncbi:MAG: ATP-binding protein [Gammaproteobacteria bacterium]|nr:ATP-binding protein [Gammaproteobacteria bacterium]MDE0453481.1 ATP-binding protein [Gammaproteobacteria bacterium]
MKSNNSIMVATVLSLVLVAAVSVLYWLVRNNDVEGYRSSISGVQQIQQLAADWSIETARVRSDPLADFDSLVAFIPQMNQLKGVLMAQIRSIPDVPDRLANDVSAYVNAVDAKEERIERFKTGYAVIRNSSRYLPLAAANIVQAPDLNRELLGEVTTLTNEIDGYLAAPTDATKGRLTVALERLGERASVLPSPLPNYFANFISHAEVLLERQAPTDELFSLATSNEISDLAIQLVDELGFELGRKQERNGYYFNGILAAAAALLLLWIAFGVGKTRTAVAQATASPVESAAAAPAQRAEVVEGPGTGVRGPAPGAEKSSNGADSTNAKLLMSHKILSEVMGKHLAETADDIATGIESLTEANDRVQDSQSDDERAEVVATANAILARVRSQAAEIAEVAERLSALGKRQGGASYSLVDVNDCLEEVVAVTQAENVAAVETEFGDAPDIFALRPEICLMLEKVVENSVQAIQQKDEDEGGEIRIATSGENDKVFITIIDNGVGMSTEVREKMFQPFYSATGERSGVGLTSTTYLVEKYGGSVSVSSMLGGGTVTRISLPGMPE